MAEPKEPPLLDMPSIPGAGGAAGTERDTTNETNQILRELLQEVKGLREDFQNLDFGDVTLG
jgi:hypothetical protein